MRGYEFTIQNVLLRFLVLLTLLYLTLLKCVIYNILFIFYFIFIGLYLVCI